MTHMKYMTMTRENSLFEGERTTWWLCRRAGKTTATLSLELFSRSYLGTHLSPRAEEPAQPPPVLETDVVPIPVFEAAFEILASRCPRPHS